MKLKLLIAKGLKILLNPPALRRCKIDKTAKVCSRSELTSVTLGRYTYVGNGCFMVNTTVGSFCSIADKCSIGGANHPIERVSSSPVFHTGNNILKKNFQHFQSVPTPQTFIENDVWIGIGAYIKAGVTIHNGAVIGAGSIVTHDVPAYEIWAGNPAHKIKDRFPKEIAVKLEKTKWWTYSDKKLREVSRLFDDVEAFVKEM